MPAASLDARPLNVFVTGGTGYLGRPLIERLVARGHMIRAPVRDGSAAKLPAGCTPVVGVQWSRATRDFGPRLKKGDKLDSFSLAYDFFAKGKCSEAPETVDASAWVPNAREGDEVVEHPLPMPKYNTVLSLLWFRAS
jgi:nucleoside-diphosphate-sugar epimerase